MSCHARLGSLRLARRAAESSRLARDPLGEFRDLRVCEQALDGTVAALQFLFREHGVDLRMTRAADADGLLHQDAIKLALVAFVVMPRAWDEMVPGERLFPPTDGAGTFHLEPVDS